jgi:hypothetical protein
MRRFAILTLIFLLTLNCAFAQKIRDASGMAQLRLEDDMSKEELKEQLRHDAIINAIEREYGTYVSQESFVDIDDGNTQFRIFGKTVIQGEWLKTTHETFKEEKRKSKEGRRNKHELWMVLKIEGRVRELSQPDIELSYFTTNCRKEICQTGIFESGQPMYLHFKTPADGFLSVYIVEDEAAYRLLPYQNMPVRYKNAVPVLADQEYVFFSPYGENDHFDDFSEHLIDELVMLTDLDEEYVELYLVFSTEEFIKPGLAAPDVEEGSGYEIPKSLHASTLSNWLESNRISSVNFYYQQLKLKIVN